MNDDREKVIVRTSIIGIVANIFLVIFKMLVGILSNSIAVILDAVNNLSDAFSSIVTIVGVKLAGKQADEKHPLGYGRIEYLSSLVVAALVLYAGITSLVESVKKIITPEAADYSVVSLTIIAAAVVVKFFLGRYVKTQGKKVDSGSLIASGNDASFDSLLSLSVLISAIIYLLTNVSLEAYVGVVISIVIIKSGFEMLQETLDDILGMTLDKDVAHEIKATIRNCDPRIRGAHDLVLHNYGPAHFVGSVHVSVPDTMTSEEFDALTRKIEAEVYQKHNVIIVAIGLYSYNTSNDEAAEMRTRINALLIEHEGVMQMHGFYVDSVKKTVSFDIVIGWAVKDRESLFQHLVQDVKELYPDYTFHIQLDLDI